MVKLIRLTTDNDNAIFNNTFNEDIIIPPKSKIALQNLSCEVFNKDFTINTSNNTVNFGTSLTTKRDIILNKGKFDANNIGVLLDDFTYKFNAALTCNNSTDIARQFKFSLNDNKFLCENKGNYKQYQTGDLEKKNINTTFSDVITRSGGTVGTNDSFAFLKKAFCKGGALMRIKISTYSVGEGIFGLTQNILQTSTPAVNDSDIFLGVVIEPSGTYSYINNGSKTSTGSPIVVDDTITIQKKGTNYELIVYDASRNLKATLYTLSNYTGFQNDDLYPVIVCTSSSTGIRFRDFKFTNDEFYSLTENAQILEDEQLGAIPQGGSTGRATINIDNLELAQFLGFNNKLIYDSLGSVLYFSITAPNEFRSTSLSESYIVELINIPVDSYNGLINQRQNILNTVVNTQILNNRITFNAPYPLFIDINNASTLSLRNIQARILKEDNTPVLINGLATMTILIMNSNN